jgi:hypothetical protein
MIGLHLCDLHATPMSGSSAMKYSFVVTVALTLAAIGSASSIQAQNYRSFVSSTGSDSNPCTLPAPCRSFQRGHDVTNAGGEVDALDSAGYGTLNITKAISIIGNGQAGILATCSFCVGVFINAGGVDAVNLRGLVIEGAGTGNTGIQYGIAGSLSVENCVIRGFTFAGIYQITDSNSVPATLHVSDTLISDSPKATGIFIAPSSGTSGALNRVTINLQKSGVVISLPKASDSSDFTVSDSVFADNGIGFSVTVGSGIPSARVMLQNSAFHENLGGAIKADGFGTTLWLSQITANANGSDLTIANNANVYSFGNNSLTGAGSPILIGLR